MQRLRKFFANTAKSWKANNKFTIHPFRSLHSRHLLPLSLNDYLARFSLELALLLFGILAVVANLTLANRVNATESRDQSVVFSFLRQNPTLNNSLITQNETTTILNQGDQWIAQAAAQSNSIVLTASAGTPQLTKSDTSNTIQDNVIVKTNPADTQNLRHGKTVYDVQSGDTLVTIASSFGISPATIMMENNLKTDSAIKPGQVLTILPTNGLSYTMKPGDTLEAIASKYKISVDDLLEVNDLELPSDAQVGDNIIIPTQVSLPQPTAPKKYITNNSGQIKLTQSAAPVNYSAGSLSFIWPTATHNITQGFSSRHSGIDISDSQMEPIYAAESGYVEIAGFQTNGYGNTIVINHGNGFRTRYGHASQLYVTAGQYVTKGQVIAKQGRTGHVVGATGIHLHFEITINGVHINPLKYVSP